MGKQDNSEELCFAIATCLIDEAFSIYKSTNRVTSDFTVCQCSARQVLNALKHHLDTGEPLEFVKVSFRDLMQVTSVYVNIEFIKRQIAN